MALSKKVVASAGLALFLAGMVAGQHPKLRKFTTYQAPASLSQMDLELLRLNLIFIHRAIGFQDGIGVPTLRFDPTTQKMEANVVVNSDQMGHEPIAEVRDRLRSNARYCFAQAKVLIPELSDSDFSVRFHSFSPTKGEGSLLAEFENGKLVLK